MAWIHLWIKRSMPKWSVAFFWGVVCFVCLFSCFCFCFYDGHSPVKKTNTGETTVIQRRSGGHGAYVSLCKLLSYHDGASVFQKYQTDLGMGKNDVDHHRLNHRDDRR